MIKFKTKEVFQIGKTAELPGSPLVFCPRPTGGSQHLPSPDTHLPFSNHYAQISSESVTDSEKQSSSKLRAKPKILRCAVRSIYYWGDIQRIFKCFGYNWTSGITPYSNAKLERMFSTMGHVKTDWRNRMGGQTRC